MKKPLTTQGNEKEDTSLKSSQIKALLQQQAKIAPDKNELLESLSESFQVINFSLGDSINSDPEARGGRENNEDFYLICQGRVRLLGQGNKRWLSGGILTVGDVFGADSLFIKDSLLYSPIAASQVTVARLSRPMLLQFLESLPELQQAWHSKIKHTQTLIFFKTLTDCQSESSAKISSFLPYLQEKSLQARETLDRLPKGRYWLRQGQIEGMSIGDSWDNTASSPPAGVTATDVVLYYLPAETAEKKDINREKRAEILVNPAPKSNVVPLRPPTSKNQPVDFPKPLKRRFRFGQKYPWLEQQSAADCGATCLAMISLYWGKRLSLNSLRELAGVGRSGVSLKNLAKTAETLGYQSRPVRASLNRLLEQKNPWIAHWQGDHFVVVYPVSSDRLLVADPAQGKRYYSRQQFLQGWTGYALLLEPTAILGTIATDKPSFKRFFQLLSPYRGLGLQIILISLLIQLFGLITPLFTQIILDKVVVNRSLSTLNVFALGVLLFGLWSVGLVAIRQYWLSYLSNRLDLTMISGFIGHALKLPLKFFESRHVGDIITRVNENEKIQRFLISQVILAWLDFLMGFVYLGLMFFYNWQLTLLVIALIPPIALLTIFATPFLRQVSREVFNEAAQQNSSLVETISGIATVKSLGAEGELRWRWEEHLTGFLNARFRGQKLGINLQAASGTIHSLGSTALLWYGATLVIENQLTIGQFVAFNMLIGKVLSPVLGLVNLWDELQEVTISIERLDDVFSATPEETSDRPLLTLPGLRGEICFDSVSFRYHSSDESNVLENISFSVNPGETLAVVGRSGSGKSTLFKLVESLYHPDSGTIRIDGHDLTQVSPTSLRAQMGVVPQECFLFSGTIIDNIRLYRHEYSLEEVIEAAKLAEAHAFIQNLPLGYNTKVGERGMNLSGGQRQRIAIARALLGNPKILLLDEATSSLDTESERRFQDNLARLSRDRTTLIIAHRLSTVRNADSILVLDRGLLVERGTHEDLMALKGLYYYLAHQQLDL
ncbi:peptidase domain-containing ABC transporter [Microcystis aeruginosa]|uniref:Alpha-hemolysin translocation ATP-binding protein HlyB n=1 Tax=Microcystis aeruginosa NIES-2521 TaxID=2303983 RepID=A0A5A5RY22_MICAE|nr:peptidase domain-containing ABC transporter [Microcystis aeruginosa]GCA79958.1 alpha-hemolysin translocation ATP-binding protein HlyB [Microcystis aeruginosa NIES-2521]